MHQQQIAEFWRIKDLCVALNVSRNMVYRMRRDTNINFPKPSIVGETQLWNRQEVLDWLESQKVAA